MEPLTKRELLRVRHVNDMKKLISVKGQQRKLMYCAGANLVLLLKSEDGRWLLEDETGPWFDIGTAYWNEVLQ